MQKYILKRVIISLFTIFVVATVVFFLIRLMPGGPFEGDKITAIAQRNLEVKYGLDKPIYQQYFIYMNNLFRGDFGESMIYPGKNVTNMIKTSFPVSAKIGLMSVFLSILFGILLGIISALNQGMWEDKISTIIATIGITIPSYVVSILLIYSFAVNLKWFNPVNVEGVSYIIPVIALSGSGLAFITRLVRSKMLEVMQSDYIRTARAKGLKENAVIYKHALKNSLIPIVTYLGPLIAGVLTGSFVVEKIFNIPGLGREYVASITNRDYTTILGLTVFYCVFIILSNLVVDILYVIIDPRIKLDK